MQPWRSARFTQIIHLEISGVCCQKSPCIQGENVFILYKNGWIALKSLQSWVSFCLIFIAFLFNLMCFFAATFKQLMWGQWPPKPLQTDLHPSVVATLYLMYNFRGFGDVKWNPCCFWALEEQEKHWRRFIWWPLTLLLIWRLLLWPQQKARNPLDLWQSAS